jgi:transmembrane sensor
VVELNAGAQLVAEPSARERRVRLVAGEAFFQVSKDPSRPFIVETPLGSVQVTGTAFNVFTDSAAGLRVVVQEGSVRVSPGGSGATAVSPVALRPGDEFRADAQGTGTRSLSSEEMEAVLGWRAGWAILDHTPLQEALARFGRYHGRVLVPEASIAGLEVGGRFALEDLEGFLSALETILPVRVTRDLNGTVRVVRRDSTP